MQSSLNLFFLLHAHCNPEPAVYANYEANIYEPLANTRCERTLQNSDFGTAPCSLPTLEIIHFPDVSHTAAV